jgi:recombination protein RecA
MSNAESTHLPSLMPISSGSLRLDLALGTGGLPRGQIIEISGPIESGKTTLCLHVIVEAQKLGEMCAWIDADHTFTAQYAAHCGVTNDQLYLCEPSNAEQALEITQTLVSSGALAVIILDSVDSLVTQNELDSPLDVLSADDMHRILSQWLHRLAVECRETGTMLIFSSRTPAQLSATYHGLKADLARLALPMQAALRLKMRQLLPPGGEWSRLEQRIEVKILKNSLNPCFKTAVVDIIINKGVYKTGEIFDLGVDLNLLPKKGPDFMYRDNGLGNSRECAIHYLYKHPDLADEIEQDIRQRLIFARHG